ncbi:cupin domain-containing protein [Kutzneria sp. NPDC052558]|uniref:cupin domain-containing protein n=1 Tax=Kutzneria sp. NPDC052558 TaxID=3364121 RepID=UPI0037CA6DCE
MDWTAESTALREKRGLADYEPLKPFVSRRSVESSLWYEGQLITVYANREPVENSCCVWEGNLPEGVGPPPHIHHYEHELFFIIEGGITAWVEGEPFEATENSLMFMPAGRIHWFVTTAPLTRMLSFTLTARGDFPRLNDNVALFRFMGRPAEALTLPPAVEDVGIPDLAEINRVVHETLSDMPDLERLGWRRSFTEEETS